MTLSYQATKHRKRRMFVLLTTCLVVVVVLLFVSFKRDLWAKAQQLEIERSCLHHVNEPTASVIHLPSGLKSERPSAMHFEENEDVVRGALTPPPYWTSLVSYVNRSIGHATFSSPPPDRLIYLGEVRLANAGVVIVGIGVHSEDFYEPDSDSIRLVAAVVEVGGYLNRPSLMYCRSIGSFAHLSSVSSLEIGAGKRIGESTVEIRYTLDGSEYLLEIDFKASHFTVVAAAGFTKTSHDD